MEQILLGYGPLGVMVVGLALWGLRLDSRLTEKDRVIADITEKRILELTKSQELAMEVRALLHALVREDR